MNFKKAFTLAEILIAMMIMATLIIVVIKTLRPDRYDEKTNLAQGQKMIGILENAMSQVIAAEKVQCPVGKYMIKPAGGSWEFAIKNAAGTSLATTTDLATLFEKHIKYESGVINFCDYTGSCSSTSIKGAKIAGGAYIGFNKYSSIKDCPTYYIPGDTTSHEAPKEFVNGAFQTKKCWGQIHIDVNGLKGPDTLGQDVFVYGLGEYGIEK